MRSRAAIGDHPIHPMLVPLPIGSFFLALVGDMLFLRTDALFWYGFARYCILVGVLTALLAAVAGLIDYLGVEMSPGTRALATRHMIANLSVVGIEVVSFFLRRSPEAVGTARWPLAAGLSFIAFCCLLVAGWLGGRLVYEHRVGVVEDAEARPASSGADRSRAA